jgi:hypothetical protein
VFENRDLRKVFGLNREEVMGNREKCISSSFMFFYCLPNIIWVIKPRKTKWARHVAMCTSYSVWVGELESKRPLGRPKRKWKNYIKRNLEEIEWEAVNLIPLAKCGEKWWAVMNTVMNI